MMVAVVAHDYVFFFGNPFLIRFYESDRFSVDTKRS
jgi:hypothetical protein